MRKEIKIEYSPVEDLVIHFNIFLGRLGALGLRNIGAVTGVKVIELKTHVNKQLITCAKRNVRSFSMPPSAVDAQRCLHIVVESRTTCRDPHP